MVKKVDESPKVIGHIGIGLWRAAHAWKRAFAEEMAARGYPWHLEARGEVLAHLGPSGRSQADLTNAMNMTKQAVQQLVDQLEQDGVVLRVPDPEDKRAKRVELTEKGLEDFSERTKVKLMIEAQYREKLGAEAFDLLVEALDRLRT